MQRVGSVDRSGQPGSSAGPDRITLLAFTAMVIIGGLNFVIVKFSNAELKPFYGAGVRFAITGLIFFGWVAFGRIRLPRGRELGATIVYGLLSFTGAYALAYFALLKLPSGVASVIMASVPLLTLFFAAIHGVERLRIRGLMGATLAIGGIAVMFAARSGGEIAMSGLIAMLGAALCASESSVILKRFVPGNPVAINAVAMTTGSVFLFLLSATAGEPWIVPGRGRTWLALGYLILVGSLLFFWLFLFTLKRWTPSGLSYMFVLLPVVASIAASLLANEALSLAVALGGLVVLGGVYVGALSGRGKPVASLEMEGSPGIVADGSVVAARPCP